MPRNGLGVHIPPAGTSPILPNTLADANKVQPRMADLENEVTNSLPRSGIVGMTGQFRAAAGSGGAPGISFEAEGNTGFALISGRNVVMKNGVVNFSMGASDTTFNQPVGFASSVSFSSNVSFSSTVSGILPPGIIFPYAGSVVPSGYLICGGQAVNRTTFAALFGVIGTLYGAGDGFSTFNVPDYRGRVPSGLDSMGGVNAGRMPSAGAAAFNLGGAHGADQHALAEWELASHTHGITVFAGGGHTPSGTVQEAALQGGGGFTGNQYSGGGANSTFFTRTLSMNAVPDHTHSASASFAGSSLPHNNVQPTIFQNYIIKT